MRTGENRIELVRREVVPSSTRYHIVRQAVNVRNDEVRCTTSKHLAVNVISERTR